MSARARTLLVLAVGLWSPRAPATDGFQCEEFREDLLGVVPAIDRREVREALPPPELVRVEEHVIAAESVGCVGEDPCGGRYYTEMYVRNLIQPLVLWGASGPNGSGASCGEDGESFFFGAVEVEDGLWVVTRESDWPDKGFGCLRGLDEDGYRTPRFNFRYEDYEPFPPEDE